MASDSTTVVEQKRSKLLKLLAANKNSKSASPKEPSFTVTTDGNLSPAQQRIWLFDKLQSGSAQYNIPLLIKFDGVPQQSVLQASLQRIIERHQVLMTVYREEAGIARQEKLDNPVFELIVESLSGLCEQKQQQCLQQISELEMDKSFNLQTDLMLRAKLVLLDDKSALLITLHHIAADGLSIELLLNELQLEYRSHLKCSNQALSAPEKQYLDYANDINVRLSNGELNYQLAYWRKHLNKLPEVHSLPLDKQRPGAQSFNGKSIYQRISGTLYNQLTALAKAQQTTVFTVLQSAFTVLLHKYSGSTDIVMGTPASQRLNSEYEAVIGCFLNPLILRNQINPESSFLEILANNRKVLLDAFKHQDVPFEAVVTDIKPNRELSYSPLFQVMIAMQAEADSAVDLAGMYGELAAQQYAVAKYDLTLDIQQQKQSLLLRWEFATDLFYQHSIKRMSVVYENLLSAITASPDQNIAAMQLLDESFHKVLQQPNQTDSKFPSELCFYQLFERQAQLTPDQIAVTYQDTSLSYEQLNQHANQFARYLKNCGVVEGDILGICLSRSQRLLIAIVALHKLGAGYLPLDPEYPQERLNYMLQDANASWVITERQTTSSLSEQQLQVCFDRFSEDQQRELLSSGNLVRQSDPAGLAYMIYTSGSTGNPKGVQVEQRNLTNFLCSMQSQPGIEQQDCLLAITSLSFDIHALELFLPLICGAQVVIASRDDAMSPELLTALIEKHSVTMMQATPATWKMLLNNGWQNSADFKAMCGGEAMPLALKQQLLQQRQLSLWNMYGPTETTVWSSVKHITDKATIGLPIANTQFYVVDDSLQLVPPGVVGELLIAGEGLARGYYNRTELNQEKYLMLSLCGEQISRKYRTGDKVRWLTDDTGQIVDMECLGRTDQQIKIRGFRIELSEIEFHINQSPVVVDSAVALRSDHAGNKQLVAYCVCEDNFKGQDIQSMLRDFLSSRLPKHMLPQCYMALDNMPLTANGKVDRNALPELASSQLIASTYLAPANSTEQQLCEIWQSVLGSDKVGVTDNFFSIGGDSILAIQIQAQARKKGIALSNKDVFQHQTIRALTEVIGDQQAQPTVAEHSPQNQDVGDYPLATVAPELVTQWQQQFAKFTDVYAATPLQQGLLFHSQLNQQSGSYIVQQRLTFSGTLQLDAMQKSWLQLVKDNTILRTLFVGQPAQQLVLSEIELPWDQLDLQAGDSEQQQKDINAYAQSLRKQGFPDSSSVMFRITVFKLAEASYSMLVTMHHAVIDGWSLSQLFNDLFHHYAQLVNGAELVARPRPEFKQYIAWLNKQDKRAAEQFWQQQVAELDSATPLGIDKLPIANHLSGNQERQLTLSGQQTERLRKAARNKRLTLGTLVQAAWAYLLYRYSGNHRVVFGLTTSGRNADIDDINDITGLFINTLPGCVEVNEQQSLLEWLQGIQQQSITREQYSHMSLAEIQALSSVEAGNELFNSIIVFENYPIDGLLETAANLPAIQLQDIQSYDVTHYPLTLSVRDLDCIDFLLEFGSELFVPSCIDRMLGHLHNILMSMTDALLSEAQTQLTDLVLMSDQEQSRVLREWNNTAIDYPQLDCIHTMFERMAQQYPENTAAVYGNQTLNYQALNSKANQLAHYLISLGCGPGEHVGICTKRDLDMVVGILAILKCGAAYLPIDPVNPDDRASYMMQDSQIDLLLSQKHTAQKYQTVIESLGIHAINLDQLDDELAVFSTTDPQQQCDLNDTAYMMYTSGSTGKPKGALVHHVGAVNHMLGEFDVMDLHRPFNFLQSAATSSDVSVWQTLAPLITGGATVIIDNMADAPALFALLQQRQLDIIELVPSVLRLLLEYVEALPEQQRSLPALKWLMVIAEACPVALINQWLNLYPDIPIMNGYGPTEASDDITWYTVDKPLAAHITSLPIGVPLANMNMFVLDDKGRPQPIGVPGELCVSGVGVGKGYWNKPEKTAEAFVANPFVGTIGDTIYRTGDVGRWMPDGNLEFMGRKDNQVKIRGFRVELGEIEAALSQLEVCKQCAVLINKQIHKQPQLVAYVIANEADTSEQQLTSLISKQLGNMLPEYMVPAYFVYMDEFPLNTADKVDRHKLPAPVVSTATSAAEYIAPTNDAERILCEVWAEVLQVEQVGITDNFFKLGGHSLLAGKLIVRMHQAGNVKVPLGLMFEQPTIAGILANYEQGTVADEADIALPQIIGDSSNNNQPFALTPVQQAYWVGRNGDFELGNVSTHEYAEIECTGLNVSLLNSTLNKLIDHHEMLRMVVDENGLQRVLSSVPEYQCEYSDLSDLDSEQKAEQLLAIREQMHHRILPADVWPQFDFRVTRVDEQSYRLHVSIDALISDAWSGGIFIQQLNQLYMQPELALAPVDISFRDYVIASEELKQHPLYVQSKEYWMKRLETLPAAPALPLVVNPADIETPLFQRRDAKLDTGQWQAIKQLAGSHNLTPANVLYTVFAEVLARWTKEKHFTLNLTLFNRLPLHSQVDDLIGDFTSLTLLEIDHRQPASFAARAKQLQARLCEDLEHRYFSGVELMREIARQSDNLQGAVMPVVFTSILGSNTDDFSDDMPFSLGNVSFQSSQTPQVWLDHMVEEINDELYVSWEAVEELFPVGLLDDMFAYYVELLNRLATAESAWSQQQDLPLTKRQQRALKKYNDTGRDYNAELLHMPFVRHALASPLRVALCTSEQQWTYGEVLNIASHLALDLQAKGATTNKLIAVVMDKCWQQTPAVIATLLSGAAYLPIDATQPKERIQQLLKLGDVELVLTTNAVKQRMALPAGITAIAVDDGNRYQPVKLPEFSQKLDDIAYVIFTSGSTGTPKGVVIDHRGANNTIVDMNRRFAVSGEDAAIALSSLCFDLSVYDIFGMLSAGGKVVVPEAELERDPEHWLQLAVQRQVTIWNTVPALQQIFVSHLESKQITLPSGLRLVMMSGDWIPVSLPDRIRSLKSNIDVYSLGGATEASIWSICYPIAVVEQHWKSIPYGRPMDNQRFYVLDKHLQPCPEYVQGELYIGGIGLAKAYWKDSEKTNASFIYHPESGERLYRTGDLGRFLPEGEIEFIGREDHQIKLNGYRIELGEVESVLTRMAQVKEAVVQVQELSGQGKVLVAYFVAEPGYRQGYSHGSHYQAIRQFVAEHLPGYMTPSYVLAIDSVPLTANGKVNRKSLPLPQISGTEADSQYIGPTNQLERVILEVWQGLFGRENIGINENFFSLGGDSIINIQQLGKLRQRHYDVKLADLYANQTIAELAGCIANLQQTGANTAPAESPRFNSKFELAPMQRWFFETIKVDSHHANLSAVFDVSVPLDKPLFLQAASQVINHHKILTCKYRQDKTGEWLGEIAEQQVATDNMVDWLELKSCSSQECAAAKNSVILEAQQSMSLQQGQLVALRYFERSDGNLSDQLFVAFHLLAADGVSLRIFMDDLSTAYQQLLAKKDVSLLDYTPYPIWSGALHQALQSDHWQQQARYWQTEIPTAAEHLIAEQLNENVEDTELLLSTHVFSEQQTKNLLSFVTSFNLAIDQLHLQLLAQAWCEWSGSDSLLVDFETHGRGNAIVEQDLSRTMGWFTTMFPLHLLKLEQPLSVAGLQRLKGAIAAVPMAGQGFNLLKYSHPDKQIRAAMQSLAQPQVSYNHLGTFNSLEADAELFAMNMDVPANERSSQQTWPHKLSVSTRLQDGRLVLDMLFDNKYLSADAIQVIQQSLVDQICSLTGIPSESSIGSLELSD